jgi:hypothetical protein
MKGNELQKTDYAAQIEALMARIRRGQGNRITRPPAPEIFDLYCFCAVFDKPYTLRFVRQPSGRLRFSASVKEKPVTSPDNIRAGGIRWTMRLDFFETAATPCAWCGDKSFHHCASYCGPLVCGGRMKGDTFHCRRSCGASWVGVPLEQVEGTVAEKLRLPSSPAPARRLLLLGPGSPTKGEP